MKAKRLNAKLIFLGLIIFGGIFSFGARASATNYYVRTDGNDNCNGSVDASGSSGNCAFRTVQKGIDVAVSPGDVVNIRGDHTDEGLLTTKADGCSGASCATSPTYITIQITPGAQQYSAIIRPGIQINHSYNIVNGLGITGSYGYSSGYAGVTFGWDSSPSHSKVTSCHFYNPSQSVGSAAITFDGHDNIAENNLIEGDTNPVLVGGHHTGANGTTLSDSYSSAWTSNQWQGRRIWDFTDPGDSWAGTDAGTVIANDAHSLTTSLGITWETGDCYAIGSSYWIPIVSGGVDNIFRRNIVRNLINTERVFDGLLEGTIIEDNEVSNLLDSNENRPDLADNCGAHTDLFQIVGGDSFDVTIQNNYFHDLEAQTCMMEGDNNHDWLVHNNIFANITHRNTCFAAPNDKIYNNTFFNIAQSDQVYPLEGWATGGEYRNNIIIGGTTNPNFGIIGGGPMGDWVECAKNVITQTWSVNTDISHWIGQGGEQAMLTANGSVYVGAGSGNTGATPPNWSANCPNVGNTCTDSGITWTNTAWNTTCVVSGTVDVMFGDQWGWNKKTGVTSSFTCNPSAVPDGDPRIYDAEGIKSCLIKDSSNNPASNNYYGMWNPPTYGARTAELIDETGDHDYINGGNPKFIAAYTDCVNNTCDFRLQSDSPLIGAGIPLAGVPTDKVGFSRPDPPSIGAYEYISGIEDVTAPTSPSGFSVS